MKYCYREFSIKSPFPTTAFGHLCQTFDIYEHKDDLKGRIIGLIDKDKWLIHLSLDVMACTLEIRDYIIEKIKAFYKNDNINLIISTTHTHYSHNLINQEYQLFIIKLIINELCSLEFNEIGDITTDYIVERKVIIGKSRITDYESNNEYLGLLRFYAKGHNFLTVVLFNCHPTTLSGMSNFFSAEYPGYILKRLKETHPNTDFTFMQGACGDISTRFTRSGTEYSDMCELAEKLFVEIEEFSKTQAAKVPLELNYIEQDMHYEHEFTPLDLSNIRSNLSQREIDTIKDGQAVRALAQNQGVLSKRQVLSCWRTGSVKLVFFPNEIFSAYMDLLDMSNSYLVSLTNGYGPYVTPIDFPYFTYEIFLDTTTKDTKLRIMEHIKNI